MSESTGTDAVPTNYIDKKYKRKILVLQSWVRRNARFAYCITFTLAMKMEIECVNFEKHIKAAGEGRLYRIDAENNHLNDKYSVDLQKVVMLPRMPGVKTVVFTKRITLYNKEWR